MIDLKKYCVRCDSEQGWNPETSSHGEDWCWVCYEQRLELPSRIKELVNAAQGK